MQLPQCPTGNETIFDINSLDFPCSSRYAIDAGAQVKQSLLSNKGLKNNADFQVQCTSQSKICSYALLKEAPGKKEAQNISKERHHVRHSESPSYFVFISSSSHHGL